MLAGVKQSAGGFASLPDPNWWETRRATILDLASGEDWEETAQDALAEMGCLRDGRRTPTANLARLMAIPDAAAALEMTLEGASVNEPRLAAGLRDELIVEVARKPIGDRLG